ncbi:HET-domain-containing protein [Hypoxylon sp. FL1284]|nr:HET-domain-containing protein [Hypoxylon sp. FL1284]
MTSAREDFRTLKGCVLRLFYGYTKDSSRSGSIDPEDEFNADEKNTIAASPSNDYQYTSLPNPDFIRLIDLQPGKGRDLIVCKLRTVQLGLSAGQYDALSYFWGSQKNPMRIQVDDAGFNVGANLHSALVNLRYPDRHRTLWIDAICINQADIAERNMSVPLMRGIYSNAACTACFLGSREKTTPDLYAMMEDLAKEAKELQADGRPNNFDAFPSFIRHFSHNPTRTSLADKYNGDLTVNYLVMRSWWHRVWTVQEMVLSQNAVLMIGRHAIKWETICLAVDHGFNLQIWMTSDLGFILDPVVVPYLTMRALTNRRRLQSLEHKSPSSQTVASDLLHLLIHCRHRRSTDPRDKVYGVLGLLRDAQSDVVAAKGSTSLQIKPDYTHPVAYVFRNTTESIISHMNSLDILGTCPPSTRRGLPSWVTDWSVTTAIGSPLTYNSLDERRETHATKRTAAQVHFPHDGVTMVLSGHTLTTVGELAQVLPSTNEKIPDQYQSYSNIHNFAWWEKTIFVLKCLKLLHDNAGYFMSIYGVLFAWSKFAAAHPPTNPSHDPGSVFWQTICAGSYKNGSVAETEALYRKWVHILKPVREFMEGYPGIHYYVPEIAFAKLIYGISWEDYGEFWMHLNCSRHRRIGRAANGRLCLLPESARVGDEIFLARGGSVPLVKRPDGTGYSMFVGEAYIFGIMDGEAFEEEKCEDIKIC